MTKAEAADIICNMIYCPARSNGKTILAEALNMAIKSLRADAVEVVRCKDCKHYHKDFESRHFCWRTDSYSWASNDFCAYGERKTGKDGEADGTD